MNLQKGTRRDRMTSEAEVAVCVLALTLVLGFASCGGGGSTPPPLPPSGNPVPTLTSTSPVSALAGGPSFTLTVFGTKFISSSTIRWNGSDRPTTFKTGTQLTAAIDAGDIASTGSAQVTVSTPTPGGGVSNALTLTIMTPPPFAVATSRLPDTAAGKFYYFIVYSSGGVPPATWTLTAGSLPLGLTLDGPTGLISGTVDPAAAGTTASFTLQAADSATTPHTATRDLSITVQAGPLGRNDTCTAGTPAGTTAISNGRLRASISPYGDIDVYSFHATAGAQVTIETFAQQLDIDTNLTQRIDFLDTVMELLDPNCAPIALNDDLSLTPHIQDSLIRVSGTNPFPANPPENPADVPAPTTLTQTGFYYIRIRDFRGDGRPDLIYDLSLTGAD